MEKNTLLTLCFLLFAFVYTDAQSVKGIISDESGEPLIGASILVVGTSTGATSDIDGSFELSYAGKSPFTIEISYTGFESQQLEITESTSDLKITLAEAVLIGQEVVISASRKREKIQEAPASISVLTGRKLAGSPQIDPVRNLINVPGVQIQQQSAARFNIEIRGGIGLFDTNAFPIMDYRSLVGPGVGTFQSDQSGISRIDLERIEVIRGPGSALYGPGVTTGVIHFITKNPIEHPGTTVEVGGGELGTFISALRHAGRNEAKTFGYKINATYNRGDEFTLDPNDPTDLDQMSLFQTTIVNPIITNEIVDLTKPGEVLLTQEDLDPDGDGNMMQDHFWNASINTTLEFRPQSDLSFTVSGGINTGSSVFYNDLGEGLAQAFEYWGQARMQKGGLFAQFFYVNNNGGTPERPTFLYQSGNRTSVGRDQIEGQIQYNFQTPGFLNADWTIGTDYREAISETFNLVYGRQEDIDNYRIIGAYVQGKFALLDKLDLFLAARYDDVNFVDEGAFSPRIAAVYKPSPKHTVRASFNRAVSLPTALDVYIDFPLNVPVPGLIDFWYAGMYEPHIFDENPMIDVTLPGVPDLPYGTPGLPLGIPYGAVNDAVLSQLIPGLEQNPVTAPLAPAIEDFLRNYTPGGFTGSLVGFNVFNNSVLDELEPTTGPNLTTSNTYEIGYKGLLSDKMSFSADFYRIETQGARSFTQIGPLMTLQGHDIPNDLSAQIATDITPFLIELLTPVVGPELAPDVAGQITPAIAGAYFLGGEGFVEQVPAPLLSDIFGAVETSRMPTGDDIVHVPVGLRALDDASANRWGMDFSLEYHFAKNFSAWANYSYVSKVTSKADESVTTMEVEAALGNTPNNKYRFGVVYAPQTGLRANVSFQHNDGFTSGSGQYQGPVAATNLVDASIGYQFDNGITLDINGTNIFNSEYRALPRMPIIGRRILAKITYTFGNE